MRHEEFETLAITFGANLNRWPEEKQAPAKDYISRHPQAAAVLEEIGALDRAMVRDRDAAPGVDLKRLEDSILARTRPAPSAVWLVWWRYAGSMALALLLGTLLIGNFLRAPQEGAQQATTLSSQEHAEMAQADGALTFSDAELEYLFGNLTINEQEEWL